MGAPRDNVTTRYLLPLHQNESKCETIHVEILLRLKVHFHANPFSYERFFH